jgi:hypothetical protein
MVKIEFKIDIICVRLIILNFLYYIVWCDSWYVLFACQKIHLMDSSYVVIGDIF